MPEAAIVQLHFRSPNKSLVLRGASTLDSDLTLAFRLIHALIIGHLHDGSSFLCEYRLCINDVIKSRERIYVMSVFGPVHSSRSCAWSMTGYNHAEDLTQTELASGL
jgi:hypothetical protein